MGAAYRFDPESFSGILGVSEDLRLFYQRHTEYTAEKSLHNRLALEKQSRDLFFTIKHRTLEGSISRDMANGLREYMEDLLDD